MDRVWEKKWVVALMAFVGSVAGALGTNYLTERSKTKWQQIEWKQAVYHDMIDGARFFLDSTPVEERPRLQQKFLSATKLCRLYCPDKIVGEVNKFSDTIFSGPAAYPDRDVGLYFRNFQLALRKDLICTKLTERDFHFR